MAVSLPVMAAAISGAGPATIPRATTRAVRLDAMAGAAVAAGAGAATAAVDVSAAEISTSICGNPKLLMIHSGLNPNSVWNHFKTPFFLLQPAEHFNIEGVPLQSNTRWACRINDRLFL
jgi:hypothetical protein